MEAERVELYKNILDIGQEIVLVYDEKGNITFANKSANELMGYLGDEIVGHNLTEVFTDLFEVREQGRLYLKPEHELNSPFETVIYRKNKTCFPVEANFSFVKENDEFVLFLCTAVNITNYKESIRKVEEKTEEVKESMKARDSFVANVTHELRTPVNGIKGHTELILEKEDDPQKQNYLRLILDCCSTMQGIINNILDFSKLEAGKFQLDEKPFEFREFMSKSEKMFAALCSRKGLTFSLNVAPEVPDLLIGDELRLTQILNNLVSNAVKFTEQGYVGIEVMRNMQLKDEVELFFIVVDTGIGLSPEDKDKLFKSFSQADASITRKYGGTGLGLSITKELVNMMKGEIWADGVVGKGSSFSFTIRLGLQETGEEVETVLSMEMPKVKGQDIIEAKASERDLMLEFGTEINSRELRSAFEKLNLSMDMENWMKAEAQASRIKQLVVNASRDAQRLAFKLEMTVRKSEYEKAVELADELSKALDEEAKKVEKEE